jgi:acetoin utilization protein AcuB
VWLLVLRPRSLHPLRLRAVLASRSRARQRGQALAKLPQNQLARRRVQLDLRPGVHASFLGDGVGAKLRGEPIDLIGPSDVQIELDADLAQGLAYLVVLGAHEAHVLGVQRGDGRKEVHLFEIQVGQESVFELRPRRTHRVAIVTPHDLAHLVELYPERAVLRAERVEHFCPLGRFFVHGFLRGHGVASTHAESIGRAIPPPRLAGRLLLAAGMRPRQIYKFMSVCTQSIPHDATMARAHQLMREHHVRHLPVLDGGVLVGVVSDRDLHFTETLRGVDDTRVAVEEAMTREPFFVAPDAHLADVAAQMAEHKYGCAVVMDGMRVVGMFTTTDALRALVAVIEEESATTPSARSRA